MDNKNEIITDERIVNAINSNNINDAVSILKGFPNVDEIISSLIHTIGNIAVEFINAYERIYTKELLLKMELQSKKLDSINEIVKQNNCHITALIELLKTIDDVEKQKVIFSVIDNISNKGIEQMQLVSELPELGVSSIKLPWKK